MTAGGLDGLQQQQQRQHQHEHEHDLSAMSCVIWQSFIGAVGVSGATFKMRLAFITVTFTYVRANCMDISSSSSPTVASSSGFQSDLGSATSAKCIRYIDVI